eukprot:s1271_g15.t1
MICFQNAFSPQNSLEKTKFLRLRDRGFQAVPLPGQMVKNKGSSKSKKAKKVKDGEAIDAEVALQVKEIEDRLQALTVEMKQVEGKIKHCALEAKRAELTEKELKPLPENLKVYRQVGKMFILQPKPDLAKSLKAQMALKTVESQQLQQALGKIQEKVKSEANGLRELIGPERSKSMRSFWCKRNQ